MKRVNGSLTVLAITVLIGLDTPANARPDYDTQTVHKWALGLHIPPPAQPSHKLYVVEDETRFVADVCRHIESEALKNGLPPGFFAKLIWKESRFDPNAISPAGAEGIAQFMPFTARTWGLENPFEPLRAIESSARLLGYLHKGYGNLGKAAAAYNAGERRVDLWTRGRSRLPLETRDYVYSITGHKATAWKGNTWPDVNFELDETRPFQVACEEFRLIKAPLQPYFAHTYYNRALALTRKADYDAALLRYAVAIRLKPTFPEAYNNRGLTFRLMGDFEKAVANYDIAIKQKPVYPVALSNRGYAKLRLGDYEGALEDLNLALKQRPGYGSALFNRGLSLMKLTRYNDAIASFSHLLKVTPGNQHAHYYKAVALAANGDLAAAENALDTTLTLGGTMSAKAYYTRALLHKRRGNPSKARMDFEDAIKLNPRFAQSRYRERFENTLEN